MEDKNYKIVDGNKLVGFVKFRDNYKKENKNKKQIVYIVYGVDYHGNFNIDKTFNILEQAEERKEFLNNNFTWENAITFDEKMELINNYNGRLNYFNLKFKVKASEMIY